MILFLMKKKILIFNILLFIPGVVFAEYTSLSGIEGVTVPGASEGVVGGGDLGLLVSKIFYFGIVLVVVLAIFGIIRGGFQYMVSADSEANKTAGRNKIWAAIGGLLLAIGSILILQTINTKITDIDLTLEEKVRLTKKDNLDYWGGKRGGDLRKLNEDAIERSGLDGSEATTDSENLPSYPGDIDWVDWSDPNQQISQYFTVGEVTKGEEARIPTSETDMRRIIATARELDRLREAWGSEIGVTSWYRPPAVNADVDGATNSQHINGVAVDIYPLNGNLQEFKSFVRNRMQGGGYGSYSSFVHIDLRGGGHIVPEGGASGPSATW
jgi:hypothetical protein